MHIVHILVGNSCISLLFFKIDSGMDETQLWLSIPSRSSLKCIYAIYFHCKIAQCKENKV